jgi:hypothetical protein
MSTIARRAIGPARGAREYKKSNAHIMKSEHCRGTDGPLPEWIAGFA